MRWSATAAVLLIVVVASLTLNVYQHASPRSVTVTTVRGETTSTSCSISGQSGGIFFRVLSDSTLKPVVGVSVTAINRPAFCGSSPATSQTVETLTTNETEWFPLPSDNNAAYSFVANYLGYTYNFSADLRPVSLTCATLFVPSGRTNATITEFGEVCS